MFISNQIQKNALTNAVEYVTNFNKVKLENVNVYSSGNENIVFEVNEIGDTIFKLSKKFDGIQKRLENINKCMEICSELNLDLIKIPHIEVFNVCVGGKERLVLAEEKLQFNPSETYQQSFHLEDSSKLDPVIDQLYQFILKSGWSDVEYRNMPLFTERVVIKSEEGVTKEELITKVALFDLEHLDGSEKGLCGDALSTGLIGLVNLRLAGTLVEKIASQSQISADQAAEACERRRLSVGKFNNLIDYYTKKNIINGNEFVQLDSSEWYSNSNLSPVTIKKISQVYVDIVDQINHRLVNNYNKDIGLDNRQHVLIDCLPISVDSPEYNLLDEVSQRRSRLNSYRVRYIHSTSDLLFIDNPAATLMEIALRNLVKKEVIHEFRKIGKDYVASV